MGGAVVDRRRKSVQEMCRDGARQHSLEHRDAHGSEIIEG